MLSRAADADAADDDTKLFFSVLEPSSLSGYGEPGNFYLSRWFIWLRASMLLAFIIIMSRTLSSSLLVANLCINALRFCLMISSDSASLVFVWGSDYLSNKITAFNRRSMPV
jgi:hypothetical protein